MRITKTTAASAAVLAALVAGATVPAAFAQDATEDTAVEQSQTPREERHAAMRAEFTEVLAAELGIEADRVVAALETVQTEMAERREAEHLEALQERLDEAVQNGSLTQEQADALLAAHEAGVLRGFGGRGPGGHGGPGGPGGPDGWGVPPPDGGDDGTGTSNSST